MSSQNSINHTQLNRLSMSFDFLDGEVPINPKDISVGSVIYTHGMDICTKPILCIKKLPHEGQTRNELCKGTPLGINGLAHPAIFASIKQSPGSTTFGDLICTIAIINTWRDTPLEVYVQNRATLQKFRDTAPIYMPTEQCTAYKNQGVEFLQLSPRHLRKQSYVNFNHLFDVPIHYLRAFSKFHSRHAYELMLSKESYTMLMGWISVESQRYMEKEDIVSTAMDRIRVQAAGEANRIDYEKSTALANRIPDRREDLEDCEQDG